MANYAFYAALRHYLATRTVDAAIDLKKVTRVADNFIIKDHQLFYTGPSRQYMRLVILSDEQKQTVLKECHNKPGTGKHCGVRATRDRVIAGYFWSTLKKDVEEWVRCCHQCQLSNTSKKVSPVPPPIKVTEPWDVVGIDVIGPLRETPRNHQYVLTVTDLFTKWVIAEPLQTSSASEVAPALVSKLYMFGMVRKIISDRSREFVNEALNIKHAVSSAYCPQTNDQDEWTKQKMKCALRRYVSEAQNDWDVHLQAIVYGINTEKQESTQYSPYFLLFHR
ncbi:hypothetical protein AALO_G00152830 [Alosa alosa]|uniref:Integrase catalytic domain-containing protein n=1 Tax=Alosa alosa TaxID=278164 RepID=A0AAV6GHS3_9TELE|nr:hypothetical protein AALO_G00152830 [Alosa alosa]